MPADVLDQIDHRIEPLGRCRFRQDAERADPFGKFRRRHQAADIGGDLLDHGCQQA